jgi:hypothetical protein
VTIAWSGTRTVMEATMHEQSPSRLKKRSYPLLKDRNLETSEERERRLRHTQIEHESRARIRAREEKGYLLAVHGQLLREWSHRLEIV